MPRGIDPCYSCRWRRKIGNTFEWGCSRKEMRQKYKYSVVYPPQMKRKVECIYYEKGTWRYYHE